MSWARCRVLGKLLPLLTFLCAPLPLCAQSQPASAAPPGADAAPASAAPEAWQTKADQALETTQQSMRGIVERVARGVDSWFGDKPFDAGTAVTDAAIDASLIKRPEQGTDFSLRFNARLRLPNIEARTYLFVANDDVRQLVTDRPDALSRQESLMPEAAANPSFFAGLGMPLLESVDFRLGVHGVAKPYAQVRYRKAWQIDSADLVNARETLFWTTDDRVGSTTVASLEHAFSATLAARWLNAATYTQRSMQLDWTTGLGAYLSVGPKQLLSLEALMSGVNGSGPNSTDVGLQVKWAQPIHPRGLYAELLFGHFWPRAPGSSGRSQAWALGTTAQLTF